MMLTNQQIDALLKPISSDKPHGEDIAFEFIVDQIKEARIQDDPDDPLEEWETNRRIADWNSVTKLCVQALTDLSKDLQVAFWLVEAQYRQFAWDGLNVGLNLLIKLSKAFGNDLYPHNQEGKHNLITWFLNKLYLDFRNIPLYKSGSSTFANFKKLSTEDYSKAIAETKELLASLKNAFEDGIDDVFIATDDLIEAIESIEKLLAPKLEARVEVVTSVDGGEVADTDDDAGIDKDIDIDALPIIDEMPDDGRIREQLTTNSLDPRKPGPIFDSGNASQNPDDICDKIIDIVTFFENNRDQNPVDIFLRAAEKLRRYR